MVGVSGTVPRGAQPGLVVSGDRLDTPEGPIALPQGRARRGRARVVASADGARAAVVRCRCTSDEETERCTVDAVDLAARRAVRLVADVHGPAVAIDREGGWYVQSRREGRDWDDGPPVVVRLAGPDAAPVELPPGILLTRVAEEPCWDDGTTRTPP